jgi:alkanesulfonate monooxygenase SsuD/methylene tetrahydromethanopterin reductase-like flavin-dependent oxidoreductase (luciferase family)
VANAFELGAVIPIIESGPDYAVPTGAEVLDQARRAEEIGFDTVWVPDELLWQVENDQPRGAWDGISMVGAVAAVTSRVKVGTWVMAALHRNPGISAKIAETLDSISGGRFVLGLGAGHAWPGQAHAFGLPESDVWARFEEALQIIVPLLREGGADFQGSYHAAHDLVQAPRGPRPGRIPLMLGGNGPKGRRLAVQVADIYSCYVSELASPDEVGPYITSLESICEELGRDPASIGRSVGVYVLPLEPAGVRPSRLSGSAEEIADGVRAFRDVGYTQVELMYSPPTMQAVEALAPVVEMLRGD